MKYKFNSVVAFFFFATLWISSCQTSTAPGATTATTANRNLAPERVDIRGSIVTSRYNEGQVVLEIENYAPSPDSRYNRAYVLVLPTTQIIDTKGQSISLSELRQGQNVAVLLRGGGKGNFVGMGIARKLWIEEIF